MLRKAHSEKQARLAKRSKITVLCRVWLIHSYPGLEGPKFLAVRSIESFCTVEGKASLPPFPGPIFPKE
jgi:hypothetical protein